MKQTNKIKRNILSFIFIAAIAVLSNSLARETSIASSFLFSPISLFTYFGVLIGFSLTIYTFGLSMVTDIKSKIDESLDFNEEEKTEMKETLVNGFLQIKSDIWFIFYSIILVVIFSLLKDIQCPFDWNVEKWMVPETINITLFITSTIAIWDIMKSLFNLAEINLELIKKNKRATNK